jgi:teichuronic acid biosynthesis glycosyltransferase TuaG
MISILLPIYNGIEYLNDSVLSIINQTYKNWELLIGINGHKENSNVYKIAKIFHNDKIYVYDLHFIKGKSKTLNYLVKLTKYDWIALIDVDDIWFPNKLEYQIPFTKDYDVIGTLGNYIGQRSTSIPVTSGDLKNYDFLNINPILNSSSLIKKNYCYWDPDCIVEDYKLWLTLWRNGCKFYNVDKILIYHRLHPHSFYNNSSEQKEALKNLLNEFK